VLGRPIPSPQPDATRVAAPNLATALAFVRDQLGSSRVKHAQATADNPLRAAFAKVGVTYPAARVYFRAFKREHQLEAWAIQSDGSFALVKTYSICSLGGSTLGPKLRRGDEQVPEGFYHVVEFNPVSEYHLSLRLDYPNAADLVRAEAQRAGNLGGDIYLHGGCKSAGCLPLTDAGIEEIYWLAVQARAAGQREIPIDIFPARLDGTNWTQLAAAFANRKDLLAFWGDLKVGYDAFERTHRLPDVSIDAGGRYRVALAGR
jgi:murein L,D-transpeptidase YafK